MRRVPAELYMGTARENVQLQRSKEKRESSSTVQQPNVDKRTKTVIEKWEKSSNSRGLQTPVLVNIVPLNLDSEKILRDNTGNLTATRRCHIDDMNEEDDVGDIFRAEFGKGYGNEALERVHSSSAVACYLVQKDEMSIGAFSVIIFECILEDGTSSLALMIDSFAIKRKFHGKGYGKSIFYDIVLQLIHKRLAMDTKYIVFAQCVLSRPGCNFWYDKLDETGTARALFLQAYNMHSELVPVQGQNCCSPRSRTYNVDSF
jgi:hypothetical protein